MEAAAAAETRGWEMARAETDAKTATLAENGIAVAQPSEQLKADLKATARSLDFEYLMSRLRAFLSPNACIACAYQGFSCVPALDSSFLNVSSASTWPILPSALAA